MTFRGFQQPTTIIIKNNMSNAAGIASFIFGLLSIFFLAPIFVPLAVLMGIIATINRQLVWGVCGLFCAFLGFITSPILMGIFGTLSVASLLSHPVQNARAMVNSRPTQFNYEQAKQAQAQSANAFIECRNKRLIGELKTHIESANCSNPRFIESFRRINYPNMDLIVRLAAKRLEVAEKEDAQVLTEAEGNLEYANFYSEIVESERHRNLQINNR